LVSKDFIFPSTNLHPLNIHHKDFSQQTHPFPKHCFLSGHFPFPISFAPIFANRREDIVGFWRELVGCLSGLGFVVAM